MVSKLAIGGTLCAMLLGEAAFSQQSLNVKDKVQTVQDDAKGYTSTYGNYILGIDPIDFGWKYDMQSYFNNMLNPPNLENKKLYRDTWKDGLGEFNIFWVPKYSTLIKAYEGFKKIYENGMSNQINARSDVKATAHDGEKISLKVDGIDALSKEYAYVMHLDTLLVTETSRIIVFNTSDKSFCIHMVYPTSIEYGKNQSYTDDSFKAYLKKTSQFFEKVIDTFHAHSGSK